MPATEFIAANQGPLSPWVIALIVALATTLAATLACAIVLRVRLARRTGQLVDELARRGRAEAELARLYEQLEQRVHERTRALLTHNEELTRLRVVLETANQRLKRLAAIDSLTGIANRRHFDRVLDRELRRARREGRPLSLVFLDIDEFKRFNDTYGHARGDEVLRRVARALDETFRRGGDLVARYGGEEFAVLLPGLDTRRAGLYAERLRRRIWRLAIGYSASPVSDRVTISAGVATIAPRAHDTAQALLKAADEALYRAKCLGRNRIATAPLEQPVALEIAS